MNLNYFPHETSRQASLRSHRCDASCVVSSLLLLPGLWPRPGTCGLQKPRLPGLDPLRLRLRPQQHSGGSSSSFFYYSICVSTTRLCVSGTTTLSVSFRDFGAVALHVWFCVSSDGETALPVRQRRGTVAPTEQAAAHERVALPHSLLLQVRRHLPLFVPVPCLTFNMLFTCC